MPTVRTAPHKPLSFSRRPAQGADTGPPGCNYNDRDQSITLDRGWHIGTSTAAIGFRRVTVAYEFIMMRQYIGGFLRAGFVRTLGAEMPSDMADLATKVPTRDALPTSLKSRSSRQVPPSLVNDFAKVDR